MEFSEISKNLTLALETVLKNDKYLLENNIHERTICHRLGVYLEPLFPDFSVDCEYNGDVDSDKGRKSIIILREESERYKKNVDREEDKETVLIYPDIIIHRHGSNNDNLLIIETKKRSSHVDDNWDKKKLLEFTSNYQSNYYNYLYGVFIKFDIGRNLGYEISWYRNGQELKLQ